jgi:transposase
MRWRRPDEIVPHFPEGACACGLDLAGAAGLGVFRSYQQEDVPEPQPSRRYQHDLHRARCACGRLHAAPRPAGVPDAPLPAGPRLSALAVCLTVFQHVPAGRAQLLIADLAGSALPAGFARSCLRKAAGLAAEPVRLIRALIAASPAAGFDETTLRPGPAGEKKYVHGAFTELYSAFHPGTPGIETMKKGAILLSFAGIAVTDRYAGYRSETWTALAGHQACAAHLLRDPQDCAESYPASGWPEQAMRALRALTRAWHAARDHDLPAVPDDVRSPLELEFRRAVTAGLAAVRRVPGPRTAVRQQPGRELLEFCRDHEGDVLRFARDTSTWPTNNAAEQAIRMSKLSASRSPAACAPWPGPRNSARSGPTSPPPPGTAPAHSTRSPAPSRAAPGSPEPDKPARHQGAGPPEPESGPA